MLAMDGDPGLTAHPGRDPEGRPEQYVRDRVHDQRPMGQRAVKVHGRRDYRRLRKRDGD
jgi:hypothetical protein